MKRDTSELLDESAEPPQSSELPLLADGSPLRADDFPLLTGDLSPLLAGLPLGAAASSSPPTSGMDGPPALASVPVSASASAPARPSCVGWAAGVDGAAREVDGAAREVGGAVLASPRRLIPAAE